MNGKRNGSPRKRRAPRSASARGPLQTVIGYVRVSTGEQAAHGISLEEQEHRIRAYGDAHGLQVVRIERDAGISAKTTANRSGLLNALKALRKGRAGGLVVCKLDRLTRSLRDVLDLVAKADREGWQLHSIGENLDTSTPHGRFVVHLFGALAQLEREQIGERTRNGMAELRRKGKRISRHAPFGYAVAGGELVPVASEQRLLKAMLRLQGDSCGPAEIARVLNKRRRLNPRTGRAWTRGNVGAVLRTAARR